MHWLPEGIRVYSLAAYSIAWFQITVSTYAEYRIVITPSLPGNSRPTNHIREEYHTHAPLTPILACVVGEFNAENTGWLRQFHSPPCPKKIHGCARCRSGVAIYRLAAQHGVVRVHLQRIPTTRYVACICKIEVDFQTDSADMIRLSNTRTISGWYECDIYGWYLWYLLY